MRVILIRESNHTSTACCVNRHPHPNDELRGSDDREPNCDWNIFHHYGVYPAKRFSGVNSESMVKKGNIDLRVTITCAKRVQRTNTKREYHALCSHLLTWGASVR